MKYLLIILLFPLSVSSQCRYFDRLFPSVTKTADVIYGNAPSITAFYLGESITVAQDLKMDIFQPQGDVEMNRALIIFAHSGGFINGSKSNDDMQALCDTFAHYGYVTATIDYRKNFNLLSSSSSERAVWRGVQDASAAVRYFKQNAALYGIDANRIFFWGSSAGAFMALGLAYVDDSERPASTSSSPNLGCKDCSGNNFAFSSTVAGIISCWGATKDTSWIQNNNNTPAQLFHGTNDGTVPNTEGYPFGLPTITYVRGSQQVNEQLNRTSIYHEYYPVAGEDHEYWGTTNGMFGSSGPTAYWPDIIGKAKLFMTGRMGLVPVCGPLPVTITRFTAKPFNEKVNLHWNTAAEYNVKNLSVERSADGITFNRIIEVMPKGSISSGASYSSTDHYPFSGTSFYRLKITDLDGSVSYSGIVRVDMPRKAFTISQIYPNPVIDHVTIQVQSDKAQDVQVLVFDMTGRKLLSGSQRLMKGVNNLIVPFMNVASGAYIIRFEHATGTELGSIRVIKQ